MDAKIRVLVAKPGLDGHDRGAKVVAAAFRDAGFEVIYTGLHQTPEQIVEAAIQEDVDVVALSILSGAHMTLFPRIHDQLVAKGATHMLLTGGGIIPPQDIATFAGAGHRQAVRPRQPDDGRRSSTSRSGARRTRGPRDPRERVLRASWWPSRARRARARTWTFSSRPRSPARARPGAETLHFAARDLKVLACQACGPDPTQGHGLLHLPRRHGQGVRGARARDGHPRRVAGLLQRRVGAAQARHRPLQLRHAGHRGEGRRHRVPPPWARTRRGGLIVGAGRRATRPSRRSLTARGFLSWVGARLLETLVYRHDDLELGGVAQRQGDGSNAHARSGGTSPARRSPRRGGRRSHQQAQLHPREGRHEQGRHRTPPRRSRARD